MQASVFGDLENLSNEELAEVIQTPSLYQELCAHFLGKFQTLRGVQVGRTANWHSCQVGFVASRHSNLWCSALGTALGQPCDFRVRSGCLSACLMLLVVRSITAQVYSAGEDCFQEGECCHGSKADKAGRRASSSGSRHSALQVRITILWL